MHELSITQSILDIALQAAAARGGGRITAIRLAIGPFSGVVPDCVQMYLDVLAKGTAAEGARIEARRCGWNAGTAAGWPRSTAPAFAARGAAG